VAHLHVRKLDVEDASTDFASIAERPQTMPMRGNGIASKVRLGASIPIACDPMCEWWWRWHEDWRRSNGRFATEASATTPDIKHDDRTRSDVALLAFVWLLLTKVNETCTIWLARAEATQINQTSKLS
jgi:hypothetical protein